MEAQQLSSDRITTLPQTIIETILCLLPIEEAARTSILSSEWRYKWTTIPKLVFSKSTVYKRTNQVRARAFDMLNEWREMEIRRKLLYAIHQVLLLRQGPIHEFALSMVADPACIEIDQILLHLSRNHTIKKLKLKLYNFNVPISLFSLHQLTDLSLKGCGINHKPIFNGFGSLTSLSLDGVTISKETLLHLLSHCPSLKIFSERALDEREWRHSEAPTIMELFERLPVIEHLTLSGGFIEYVIRHGHRQLQVLSISLVHLNYFCLIDMSVANSYGWTFLLALIKCSPNLKKIKLIEKNNFIAYGGSDEVSFKFEDRSGVWLEHLNELEIENFTNIKPAVEFVKFVLARSPNLKKVKLYTTWKDDKDEELKMLKILLGTPYASPIKVIFENLCY